MKVIKKTASKILLSLAIVFAMISTMVPTNVFAASNEIVVDGNNGYTLTATGLNKAIVDIVEGGTIKLGGNITANDYILHSTAKNIIFDLNGYSLITTATYGVIVSNGAGITIRSSQAGGKIEASNDTIRNVVGFASIRIESGSIISTGAGNAIYIAREGDVTVSGGTISSGTGHAIYSYKGNVTISNSPIITSGCNNSNISTINIKDGILAVSGTPTIKNTASSEYGYCISLLTGSGTISGGTISAEEGIAIRAFAPLSISGNTMVTSKNPLTTNGTILVNAALTLTDTAQVKNTVETGNAIYLMSNSASYSFSATNVIGKIAPSYNVSGTITGSDTGNGITATLQLKQSNGVAIGNAITATSDGSYSVSVPRGNGYTIAVSMSGYTSGTIGPFDVGSSAQTGKNLTLTKNLNNDKDKVDEAKPLAESAITAIIATNSTTAGNILEVVTTAISSVDGVTASWKAGSPTITPATTSNAGSIIGTILLICGSETVEISVNKGIEKLSIPTPDKPTITVGNNGSNHQINNGKDMTFTCSGKLENLTGVYVDGNLVDGSNYILRSGSTILTLKANYLDTLSTGQHTLKFQYKDNISAETNFTITAKAGETPKTSSPLTGDNSNLGIYAFLLLLSSCAVGALTYKRKK